jgi:VWFA-related protein
MRKVCFMLPRALIAVSLLAIAAMVLSSVGIPLAARQQPPAQQQEPPTIRVGVSVVNIFATVRDKSKRIVPDLAKDDFRVFEDEKEQKVEFFSRETNLPLTFGLLMDTSGSMRNVLPVEQEMASRFLKRVLRQNDLALIFSFDQHVDMLTDFTNDHARLERAIQSAKINAPVSLGPIGNRNVAGTTLYDAIWLACKQRLARETGRKALVILTDAVDEGSKTSLNEAIEVAQRSDTVVHIIGVSDPAFYGGFGGYSGEGVAKKIAEQTGGRSIFVHNEKDLEKAFDEISEELRTQYTLGYYPTNSARDGKFRKLKVEVRRNGLKVLARRGYYAPSN